MRGRLPQPPNGTYSSHDNSRPTAAAAAPSPIVRRHPQRRTSHSPTTGVTITTVSLTCAANTNTSSAGNQRRRWSSHSISNSKTSMAASLCAPMAVAMSRRGFHSHAASAAAAWCGRLRRTMLTISQPESRGQPNGQQAIGAHIADQAATRKRRLRAGGVGGGPRPDSPQHRTCDSGRRGAHHLPHRPIGVHVIIPGQIMEERGAARLGGNIGERICPQHRHHPPAKDVVEDIVRFTAGRHRQKDAVQTSQVRTMMRRRVRPEAAGAGEARRESL